MSLREKGKQGTYWIFTVLFLSLFSLNHRQSIEIYAAMNRVSANHWDVLLSGVSDVYVIVYLVLPLFLLRIGLQLSRSFEYTQLIRVGSYKKWILEQLKVSSRFNVTFLILWYVSSLITALGLPFSFGWSNYSSLHFSGNEILQTLRQHFSLPFTALVLQFVLFFFTFVWIQLIFSLWYVMSKNKRWVFVGLAFLYVFSIVSFKLLPSSTSWVILPNYFSLFHGAASFGSPWIPLIIVAIVLLSSFPLLYCIGRDYTSYTKMWKTWSPMIGFFLLLMMGVIFKAESYKGENITFVDLWIVSFLGTTSDTFDLFSFTYYVIVFVGYVYTVLVFYQRQLSGLHYFSLIRLRSVVRWWWNWFSIIVTSTILYLLFLFFTVFGVSIIFQYPLRFESNFLPLVSLQQIGFHFFINGFLQLLFYILFAVLISWKRNNIFESFVALCAATVVMLPSVTSGRYIPIGLNSMGYLFHSANIYAHSLTLLTYIAIELLVLLYFFRNQDFTH